ncbi:MAG: hypothetical protein ACUVQ8_03085 [Nitrososphaeria archaeon]
MKTKIIKDIITITQFKSVPDIKRNPLTIFLISTITSFPLFFIIVSGGELTYAIIGAIVATIGFIGLNSAIQDMAWDRYLKIRQIIVSMPVNPIAYALAIALAPVVISLPGLIFFVSIALYLKAITVYSLMWAAIVLTMTWATLSSIGFLISTYLRNMSIYAISNLANILGLILVFVPPVYYPEEVLGNIRWISIMIPTSNAVGLIRAYSGTLGLSPVMLLFRWAVLLGTMVIFTLITVKKSKWRET